MLVIQCLTIQILNKAINKMDLVQLWPLLLEVEPANNLQLSLYKTHWWPDFVLTGQASRRFLFADYPMVSFKSWATMVQTVCHTHFTVVPNHTLLQAFRLVLKVSWSHLFPYLGSCLCWGWLYSWIFGMLKFSACSMLLEHRGCTSLWHP